MERRSLTEAEMNEIASLFPVFYMSKAHEELRKIRIEHDKFEAFKSLVRNKLFGYPVRTGLVSDFRPGLTSMSLNAFHSIRL